MLVLTRKTGQKLIIGGGIEIKILETHGDSVKIGIEAPKDVPIYREELYLEICNANRQQAPGRLAVDEAMALVIPPAALIPQEPPAGGSPLGL
ncbi:MAG: carbon storage regulator CsrA [Vampirovibrionales bacterium]|nr:carbon storage regulator CsrA [Vampirovibrionales bacterium]